MIVNKAKFDIARAEAGYSLKDLSSITKIHINTLYKIRRGESLDPVTVGKIATALNTHTSELVD